MVEEHIPQTTLIILTAFDSIFRHLSGYIFLYFAVLVLAPLDVLWLNMLFNKRFLSLNNQSESRIKIGRNETNYWGCISFIYRM